MPVRLCDTYRGFMAMGLLAAIGGCQGEPADSQSLTEVRDSAGVSIVELDWDRSAVSVPLLELGSPQLRIGVSQGSAEYEFDRIVSVVPLSQSRLAVADAGAANVRVFDGQGTLLAELGRAGEGPGEFRSINAAFGYRSDSLLVHDRRLNRVTIFSLQGGEPRVFTPRPSDESLGRPAIVGTLSDGRMLARQDLPSGVDGLSRVTSTLSVLGSEGAEETRIGSFSGDEIFLHRSEGFTASLPRPYPIRLFTATAGDAVLIGDGGAGSIERWTAGGSLAFRWQSSERPTALDGTAQEEHREALLADNPMPPGMAEPWAAGIRELPYPDSLPLFAGMLVDESRKVWVWRERSDDGATNWAVIDTDGKLVGVVELASEVTVFAVTATSVLAVGTDEFDVEYVEVYSIPWQ